MATPPASPPPPPSVVALVSPSTLKWKCKVTRLRSLATRLPGVERPVVHVDPAIGKANGPHKKKLRTYLGIIARDKVDVTYETWKEVPAAQKDLIWEDIQLLMVGQRRKYFKLLVSGGDRNGPLAADKDSVDDTVSEKYDISKEKWAQFCQTHRDPSWEKKAQAIQKQNTALHVLSRGGYEYLEQKLMAEKTKKKLEKLLSSEALRARHVKRKMARTKKIWQMTSEAAKEIANKIHKTILWIGSINHPQFFLHGSRRTEAVDSTNQGPAGGVDHRKSDLAADLQSQIQSQGLALPPELEVGASAAHVNTKGSCVDPSMTDPDGDSDKCGLYIKENPLRLVALGRVYEGSTMEHNIPLLLGQVKVGDEEVKDVEAPVPVPIDEVILVGQTLNTSLAWPTHLAKRLSDQVMWDDTVFEVFNEDFPLYIKHEDLSEIAHGGQNLNISVIQLWILECRCVWIPRATVHSEIWAISWMQSSKRDVYLRAHLNGPDNYLKGIINSALKGLDNNPQPKSKVAARWIAVKCNRQKGSTECGYYIMHWIQNLVIPHPFAIQTQSCPMARRDKIWSFCTLLSSRGGGPDDMRRQNLVIPHPFAIQTQSCPMARRDKIWSFCTLLSSRGGGPDDMRRQNLVISNPFAIQTQSCPMARRDKIWSFCTLLSSRGGGPDDMRRQNLVIPHPFAIQTQSCPMARRDKIWSFCTLLSSRGGGPDDMRRQNLVIPHPFAIQTQSCPMARRDKIWSFCTLLSSRGGGPDDMRRQNLVISNPFAIQTQSCPMARRDKIWSFCTLLSSRGGGPDDMRRQNLVIPHPFAIQTQSCPMARRDKIWSFCTLLSSRGGGPDDMRRQNLVIPHPFAIQTHSYTVVSDGTQRQNLVILHPSSIAANKPVDTRRFSSSSALTRSSPVESPTVATYPSAGGRCVTRGMRVPRKEYARSRHQRLFEENVGKTGKDAIYELLSERLGSCIYARGSSPRRARLLPPEATAFWRNLLEGPCGPDSKRMFIRITTRGCGMTKFCLRMSSGPPPLDDKGCRMTKFCLCVPSDTTGCGMTKFCLRMSSGPPPLDDKGCRMTKFCLCVPSDTTVSEWQRGAEWPNFVSACHRARRLWMTKGCRMTKFCLCVPSDTTGCGMTKFCLCMSSGPPPLDDKRVQNDQILSLRAIGHECSPVESPTVATYPSAGGRRVTRGMRVPRKEYAQSRHQRLFEENVGKTGKDAIYELLSERLGSCEPGCFLQKQQPSGGIFWRAHVGLYFNDVRPLETKRLKALRIQWAQYYLKVKFWVFFVKIERFLLKIDVNIKTVNISFYRKPMLTYKLTPEQNFVSPHVVYSLYANTYDDMNNLTNKRLSHLLPPPLPLNPPLTSPPPPPLTTGDHNEPPLFAIGSPHREEQFNRSGIFKTQLEDSVENEASNPSFTNLKHPLALYVLTRIGNKYLVLPFCVFNNHFLSISEISRERKVQVPESFESFCCEKTGRELSEKRKPS
ncbi:hypothetical protein HKD37_01G000961 [Glycine soja]